MSRTLDTDETLVRSRRGLGLQVLAFALTGAAIYFCGAKSGQEQPDPQAPPPCAVAVLRMGQRSDANLAQEQARLEQLLLSDAALTGLYAELPAGGSTLERSTLRDALAIQLSPGPNADECRASFVYRGVGSEATVAVVNTLARRCADAWQSRHRSLSQTRYASAKEAASRARTALAEARANLANFLDQHFQELEALSREPATATSLLQQSAGGFDDGPRLIDNPQWQAVWQEVLSLRRELAMRRGPDLQGMQARLAELEQQLGRLPRKIPAPEREPALERTPPPEPAPTARVITTPPQMPSATPRSPAVRESQRKADSAAQARLVSEYHKLCAIVEQAVSEEARLAQAEREAWQAQQREPVVAILLAGPPAARVGASPAARLFWIAVAAATAVACGVGMITSGARREPVLSTPEEVRRATTLPMFGVIREPDLNDQPQDPPRRRAGAGWWLSGGLALIVCTALSVALVLGRG